MTQYLRTRTRGNSVSRFVQVPVPTDLKDQYRGKRYIERYLDRRLTAEALKSAAVIEVGNILDEFEVKRGRGRAVTAFEEKAKREATRQTFQWLQENADTGPDQLSQVLPNSDEDVGQPLPRIKRILSKIGETVADSDLDGLATRLPKVISTHWRYGEIECCHQSQRHGTAVRLSKLRLHISRKCSMTKTQVGLDRH